MRVEAEAPLLLARGGPRVILGGELGADGLAKSITPAADTMFGPRGACLASPSGPLFVCDTGHHRLRVWKTTPPRDGTPADLVLGQSDFTTRDENAGRAASALGMRWPHGIAAAGGMILVANAGNNRVMAWRRLPGTNGAACDFVFGQADAISADHNCAAYYPTARAMSMPYGLTVQNDRLIVADTANSRLLGFAVDDLAMGVAASRLAGQREFTLKGDNRWGPAARDSVCWPYSAAACGETLVIADSGNSRVLLWEAAP